MPGLVWGKPLTPRDQGNPRCCKDLAGQIQKGPPGTCSGQPYIDNGGGGYPTLN